MAMGCMRRGREEHALLTDRFPYELQADGRHQSQRACERMPLLIRVPNPFPYTWIN